MSWTIPLAEMAGGWDSRPYRYLLSVQDELLDRGLDGAIATTGGPGRQTTAVVAHKPLSPAPANQGADGPTPQLAPAARGTRPDASPGTVHSRSDDGRTNHAGRVLVTFVEDIEVLRPFLAEWRRSRRYHELLIPCRYMRSIATKALAGSGIKVSDLPPERDRAYERLITTGAIDVLGPTDARALDRVRRNEPSNPDSIRLHGQAERMTAKKTAGNLR